MEGDLASKANMSGLRVHQQEDEPEDDPHFVLEKANERDAMQSGVAMRLKDYSEEPDVSDRVPLKAVKSVLAPRAAFTDGKSQRHRGYNSYSGLIYYNCGLSQYAGPPKFGTPGTTMLPEPQYVNVENVTYLNKTMHSQPIDEYKKICRLEVLRGINLAGGNHPAPEAVRADHQVIQEDRKMPTMPKLSMSR